MDAIPQMPKCRCSNPECHAVNDVVNQFLDTLYETIDNDPARLIAALTVVARLAIHHRLHLTQTVDMLLGQLQEVQLALSERPTLELVKT